MGRINLVELAQQRAIEHLKPGAFVVDATVGNGYDTTMLAEAVGEKGKVLGFDIQQQALTATRERLTKAELLQRVELINGSHADMEHFIPEKYHSKIALVMFNLGYLPGGDKKFITDKDSTIMALNTALSILKDDGAVSMIAYPGHIGGDGECDLVSRWCDGLDSKKYQIEKVIPETVKRKPPQWFWVSVVEGQLDH